MDDLHQNHGAALDHHWGDHHVNRHGGPDDLRTHDEDLDHHWDDHQIRDADHDRRQDDDLRGNHHDGHQSHNGEGRDHGRHHENHQKVDHRIHDGVHDHHWDGHQNHDVVRGPGHHWVDRQNHDGVHDHDRHHENHRVNHHDGRHHERQRDGSDGDQAVGQCLKRVEVCWNDLRYGNRRVNQNVNRPGNLVDDQNWGVRAFSQGYEQIADFVANIITRMQKTPTASSGGLSSKNSGSDLLSQEVYLQVPSALAGLTTVFEMGTGVSPPLWPPEICCQTGISPSTPEQARAVN